MELHEYQAKTLFRGAGLPVAEFAVGERPEEVTAAAAALGGGPYVCKCQILAGARGKAGGVACVDTPAAAGEFAARWLGRRLVTAQTGPRGLPVGRVLVERALPIARELYLSVAVDRARARLAVRACATGGTDVERGWREHPERLITLYIDEVCGVRDFHGRRLAAALEVRGAAGRLTELVARLVGLCREQDLLLAEINPLVLTVDGSWYCADAKVCADDAARFRHPQWAAWSHAGKPEGAAEAASRAGLAYVPMDGDIGCLVNGAGLAMATLDLLQTLGGAPANFLDIGGGTDAARVAAALELVTAAPRVKCVFVNIFGGIVRCDLIAAGLTAALTAAPPRMPFVVRLAGNRAAEARAILQPAGLAVHLLDELRPAAAMAVKLAAERAG